MRSMGMDQHRALAPQRARRRSAGASAYGANERIEVKLVALDALAPALARIALPPRARAVMRQPFALASPGSRSSGSAPHGLAGQFRAPQPCIEREIDRPGVRVPRLAHGVARRIVGEFDEIGSLAAMPASELRQDFA